MPYLEDWVNLGGYYGRPQHARVNTSPLVIVHIRLACLDDAGTPPRVIHSAMQGYFVGCHASGLVYIDAPFNITSLQESRAYKSSLTEALGVLDRYANEILRRAHETHTIARFSNARVLVFIYTHSESRSGDLLYAQGMASADADQV